MPTSTTSSTASIPPSSLKPDDLSLRRLKKRRLLLKDEICRLEMALQPPEPA